MEVDNALNALRAQVEPGRSEQMAAYHKQNRVVLGVPNPAMNDLSKQWRRELPLEDRIGLAVGLWQTDIFEARITAAKLFTQARIRPDEAVWDVLISWLPDFDSWAIADHAATAMQKRLVADPSRLDVVEGWTTSDHMWTRRAALVATLPWTKQNHPSKEEMAARDRILSWAATYVEDQQWFIQKAVAWWLRDLSKHDPERTRAFIEIHGDRMKPFARKEAIRHLVP